MILRILITASEQGSEKLNNLPNITPNCKQQSGTLYTGSLTPKALSISPLQWCIPSNHVVSRCDCSKVQVPAVKGPEEERATLLNTWQKYHVTLSSKENSRSPSLGPQVN